jgi:zinc protease
MRLWVMALVGLTMCSFAVEDVYREPIEPYKKWTDVMPAELKKFTAPTATRYELSNGMVVFLLEDHELPIVDLSMTIRAGEIHEPAELAGISGATAAIMRTGGSKKYPGDKLDEILERMAAEIHISGGQDSGGASFTCLKEDFDNGLEIFIDVLRNPEFPEEKIDLHLSHMRTGIDKRNDSPGGIAGREFRKYLYGKDNPYARVIEYANVDKIDRPALQAYHDKVFHPNMFIVGVVGDFKKEEMLAKLKAAFEPWPKANVPLPPVPPIPTAHEKRTLFVEKESLNQTTIMVGHVVDVRRDHKDYAAIQMMNEVLSGGMSTRLFTEVRTKKGLAYSVHGAAQLYHNRPGLFYCSALTRNEQALETVNAMMEEVVKLKEKGVTETELEEARQSLLNSFVFNFDSPSKIIGRQMTYELYGYPMDFAEKLMENIKKVTLADVNRVAAQYLDPDKMQLLGVGSVKKLKPGMPKITDLPDVQMVNIEIPGAKK